MRPSRDAQASSAPGANFNSVESGLVADVDDRLGRDQRSRLQ